MKLVKQLGVVLLVCIIAYQLVSIGNGFWTTKKQLSGRATIVRQIDVIKDVELLTKCIPGVYCVHVCDEECVLECAVGCVNECEEKCVLKCDHVCEESLTEELEMEIDKDASTLEATSSNHSDHDLEGKTQELIDVVEASGASKTSGISEAREDADSVVAAVVDAEDEELKVAVEDVGTVEIEEASQNRETGDSNVGKVSSVGKDSNVGKDNNVGEENDVGEDNNGARENNEDRENNKDNENIEDRKNTGDIESNVDSEDNKAAVSNDDSESKKAAGSMSSENNSISRENSKELINSGSGIDTASGDID